MALLDIFKPKKQEFKAPTGIWLRAVVAALARTFDVEIRSGNKWGVDVNKRVLVYDKSVEEADRDDALALILRAISGIDNATSYIIDKQYEKFVKTTKVAVHILEDIRYDTMMEGRYLNSSELLDQYKRRLLTNIYGVLRSAKDIDDIIAIQKKQGVNVNKDELIGSPYLYEHIDAFAKTQVIQYIGQKKSNYFSGLFSKVGQSLGIKQQDPPPEMDKATVDQLLQQTQLQRVSSVMGLFGYGVLFSAIHGRSAFSDQEEAIHDILDHDKGNLMQGAIATLTDNKATKVQIEDLPKEIVKDVKTILDCANNAVHGMKANGVATSSSTQTVNDYYFSDVFPTLRRFLEMQDQDGNGGGQNGDGMGSQNSDAGASGQGDQYGMAGAQSNQANKGGNIEVQQTSADLTENMQRDQSKNDATAEKMFGKKPSATGGRSRMGVTYKDTQPDVASTINTATTKMDRILKDNRTDRFGGRHRSGKLNQRRLYKHKSNDFKLFQRKQELLNKDYAFSFLIDESSSMQGRDFEEAFKGLVILNDTLDRIGVDSQIIGFSNSHVVAKEFHEKTVPQIIDSRLNTVFGGGTNIEKPFKTGLDALLKNKIPQKIMIVLTDGEVYDTEKNKIKQQMQKHDNVQYYGIGIGVDLKGIFGRENSVKVDKAEDIPKALVTIMKRNIKNG